MGGNDKRGDTGRGWLIQRNNHGYRLKRQPDLKFYFQDLVVGPGGYTGWHSHPELLLITVKEGSVEFYDKECAKHTYVAGHRGKTEPDPDPRVNA